MNTSRAAASRARCALRESVLGDITERYICALEAKRFAPATVTYYLSATAHFARWLEEERTGSCRPVRETDVREFLSVHLRRCGCAGRVQRSLRTSRAALHHLIPVLRDEGAYEDLKCVPTPVDQEIELFDSHLREVCGAALQTRLHRTRHVREFLVYIFGNGAVCHEQIHPESFGRFLISRARNCRSGTLGVITDGLRSYVRFLDFHGLSAPGLLDAVPHAARWRLASVPSHLSEDELSRFLDAFDRRSVRGRRDYAMALCLALLGLRASEVAALKLSDIDWRAGALTVSAGKTRRGRTLPLCPRIGHAIASYMRFRPRTPSDTVFVHIGAREGDPVAPSTVRSAIRLAYGRSGMPRAYTGTHLLRHTAASQLVAAGATVKEVADFLGHASLDSTVLYAKVDFRRLRNAALQWPEVIQ